MSGFKANETRGTNGIPGRNGVVWSCWRINKWFLTWLFREKIILLDCLKAMQPSNYHVFTSLILTRWLAFSLKEKMFTKMKQQLQKYGKLRIVVMQITVFASYNFHIVNSRNPKRPNFAPWSLISRESFTWIILKTSHLRWKPWNCARHRPAHRGWWDPDDCWCDTDDGITRHVLHQKDMKQMVVDDIEHHSIRVHFLWIIMNFEINNC